MKNIYDNLLQWIAATTWGQFIAGSPDRQEEATIVRNIFLQDLYLYAFCYLVAITTGAIFYYYFILNRRGGSGFGFKLKYWFYTLLSAASFNVIITAVTSMVTLSRYHGLHTFKFCLALGILNGVYLAALFFSASLIVKKFSIANRTPF